MATTGVTLTDDERRDLVARYAGLARKIAGRRTRDRNREPAMDRQLYEDALSEAYMALTLAGRAYDPSVGDFPPYAAKAIHRRLTLRQKRQESRDQHLPIAGRSSDPDDDDPVDWLEARPTDDVERVDAADWIAALPDRERRIIGRLLDGATSYDLGHEFGYATKMIKQIADDALDTLP
jgi:RNA polymerase sigma factor (sigma-70 family)